MASCAANIIKCINYKMYNLGVNNFLRVSPDFTQFRSYAARKGTRERKLKLLKAKKASKKPEDKTKPLRQKKVTVVPTIRRILEEHKPTCLDDVVLGKFYRWKVYDFAEAVQCHRETCHPTIYNIPDAYIQARIELDMTAAKKNRYVENFSRLVPISHTFPMDEQRSVIVFCKTSELQEEAKEAGANVVGDSALIKEIEKGGVSLKEFNHVLAHPNIIPELVVIRGLMRKVFPTIRAGTLGVNLKEMVARFRTGIKYSAKRDDFEQDYGLIEVNIGKLDMETEHLQENLQAVLRDVYSVRPKRPGPFITRALLCCPPSVERFKLDLPTLLPEQFEDTETDDDEDEVEEESGVKDGKKLVHM